MKREIRIIEKAEPNEVIYSPGLLLINNLDDVDEAGDQIVMVLSDDGGKSFEGIEMLGPHKNNFTFTKYGKPSNFFKSSFRPFSGIIQITQSLSS